MGPGFVSHGPSMRWPTHAKGLNGETLMKGSVYRSVGSLGKPKDSEALQGWQQWEAVSSPRLGGSSRVGENPRHPLKTAMMLKGHNHCQTLKR